MDDYGYDGFDGYGDNMVGGNPYNYQPAQQLYNLQHGMQQRQNRHNSRVIQHWLRRQPRWIQVTAFLVLGLPYILALGWLVVGGVIAGMGH